MIEGWLFDVYPVRDGMAVWFLDGEGRPHRLLHRYAPALYLTGERWAVAAAEQALAHLRMHVTMAPAVRRELMSGEEVRVVRVAVHDPLAFPAAARRLAKIPGITLYNCDIPAARLFFYETGLFPLARCAVEHAGGEIRAIETLTRPEDIEYDLPPLVTLRLRLDAETTAANPAHGRRGPFDGACPELGLPRLRANGMSDAHPLCRRARGRRLEAGVDGETVVCDGDDPGESIRSLNRLLARYDPDVILTEWGDAVLLPQLRLLAARVGIPLALNRDGGAGIRTRRSRSYTTYGQVVFQAGAQMLAGRWHIDLRNSFIYGESELAGLLEIARLARIPVQDLARTSTGTAISSMQLERAVADGVLIPWQKSEPEAFKTASQLIVTDKGGLTYQPLVGMFEQVGELDFSSMYPTMMARFNVSPETIGCACCPDSRVPEIGYTVCTRRRGLVPRVLDHLLERRAYYKRRKKETSGSARALYDQRQTALKWCLVTCLDGDTLVFHQRDGRWKIGPIREVVEAYLPGLQWGTKPVEGLAVSGVDPDLRSCPKPVKCVIKVPAPPRMIRMKLQWGRELLMTPDHQCYVLADGGLQIKRADQLKGGEWIPIATALGGLTSEAQSQVDLLQTLQRAFPLEEQERWRVFGGPVRRVVQAQYRELSGSSLAFARVLSVEEVPYAEQFVYCVQLADAPAGFFTEGGILTHNCFGYLGYRNARFGRIEAHEAVTAYAREMLLRAKEVAEARGFRMLHALVDSMWLQRPGAGRGEYEALAQAVTEATGLPIFVEGVYRWIGFLPSKTHRGVGVPNRYLGVFDDGTTKVRGIEVRRSDVPILVEQMQERLLQRMFRCATLADVQTALPELLAILEEALVRLRAGEVTAEELAVTNRLSQEVREYRHNTVQAIAARTLDRHGARLHPGEAVQFIITDHKAKLPDDRVRPYALLGTDWAYDADAYAEMLVRAAETVLELCGYSRERLRREVWDRVR